MRVFKPFSDYILVERHDEASSSIDDGLITPEAAKEKPQEGTVIAIGPGYLTEQGTRVPVQSIPNDHVLFGKYAGTEILLDGKKMLLMRDGELLGRLTEIPEAFAVPSGWSELAKDMSKNGE